MNIGEWQKMIFDETADEILRREDKLSPNPRYYPFGMYEDEKTLFDKVIKKSKHYLEFGLGGSTLRAIQKSRLRIEEIAPLAGMPEGNLYQLIMGRQDPIARDMHRLSLVLDCNAEDLFPEEIKDAD